MQEVCQFWVTSLKLCFMKIGSAETHKCLFQTFPSLAAVGAGVESVSDSVSIPAARLSPPALREGTGS